MCVYPQHRSIAILLPVMRSAGPLVTSANWRGASLDEARTVQAMHDQTTMETVLHQDYSTTSRAGLRMSLARTRKFVGVYCRVLATPGMQIVSRSVTSR